VQAAFAGCFQPLSRQWLRSDCAGADGAIITKDCDQLLRLSFGLLHSHGVPCRIPICLAEPHCLQVLGARAACGRSFPLSRTGRLSAAPRMARWPFGSEKSQPNRAEIVR
jgi:hypothetical protein